MHSKHAPQRLNLRCFALPSKSLWCPVGHARAVRSSAAAYVAAGTGVARCSSGAAAASDGVAMRVKSAEVDRAGWREGWHERLWDAFLLCLQRAWVHNPKRVWVVWTPEYY